MEGSASRQGGVPSGAAVDFRSRYRCFPAYDRCQPAERGTFEIDKEDLETRGEFYQYFRDVIAREGTGGDDLLPRLARAEEEGDRLSETELLATLALLVMAGHETTANLISHGILTLLRNPDQLRMLQADPSLLSGAVDEILRYEPSVQMLHRMAKAPIELDDQVIPAGMDILLLTAAANRDPEVFPDPDRFDITRGAGGGIDHLAFSAGPHFCLGSRLGKLEAMVALEAFVTRFADPELDPASLEYRPHVILRGPERMTVSYSSLH